MGETAIKFIFVEEIKRMCSKCEDHKPSAEFYKRASGRLSNICKKCHAENGAVWRQNNPNKNREYYRAAKKNDPIKLIEYNQYYHIYRKYGLSGDEFRRMYDERGGKCDICGYVTPIRGHDRINIDHCHDTGHIRGLLCRKCNSAIGFLSDDPLRLQSAVGYLEEAKAREVLCTQQGPL